VGGRYPHMSHTPRWRFVKLPTKSGGNPHGHNNLHGYPTQVFRPPNRKNVWVTVPLYPKCGIMPHVHRTKG
jgi:hypothetical protein